MGERKGQNKYYPPDFDYKKHGNLNRYHGTHALRERASKIHLGILRIRFEMPFNIWCEGCGNHIGMGVRYNADKTKVGMYYTTPIYQFRMKCHLCETYFEIRTDPKNFEYELVSGCRREDKRPTNIDGQLAKERGTSQKLATDAMFKLEHGEKDKEKLKSAAPQLEQLEFLQRRMFDDFAANQAARRIFRTKKKELNTQAGVDQALKDKSSLGDLTLVPETSEDKKLASMISKYKTIQNVEEKQTEKRGEINSRSIFEKPEKPDSSAAGSKRKLPESTLPDEGVNWNHPEKRLKKIDKLKALRKTVGIRKSKSEKAEEVSNVNCITNLVNNEVTGKGVILKLRDTI